MKILKSYTPGSVPVTDLPLMLYLRKRGPSLILLLLIVFLANISVLWNEFTNREDTDLVLNNTLIRDFTLSTLFQIFTSAIHGNYHPLVQLSYALDFRLAGFSPWMYHAQNLIWHLINTGLVYSIFRRLGNNRTKGWMVALFFGIHPLHAESVAWISGRKDVLYAAGFLFSVLYYYRYTVTGKKNYYRLSLAGFVWACLCKPMAMSLPLLLPLIDYISERKVSFRDTLSEKFPFFFLGVVLAWFTFLTQLDSGRIGVIHSWDQVLFACRALLFYITRTLIPLRLSAFYPFPETAELRDYLAPIILLTMLAAFFRWFPLSRITRTGWLFFLICILPVLQIFPAGQALMADRNHYVAGLGLIYLVVEFLWITWYKFPTFRNILPAAAFLLAVFFAGANFKRIQVWRNNENLYADILSYNPDIYMANMNLAKSRFEQREFNLALPVYIRMVQVYPDSVPGYTGAGKTLYAQGHFILSEFMLRKAIDKSRNPEALYPDLALACFRQQEWDTSIIYLKKALRNTRNNIEFRNYLALAYIESGKDTLAEHTAYEVLNIDPENAQAAYTMSLIEDKRNQPLQSRAWLKLAAKRNFPDAIARLKNS